MKKKIFSLVLIAAGLLSGCSSEESVSTPETIGQAGTLTFSFPASRPSVTYAINDGATAAESDVIAVGDESVINNATVYMFENSGDEKLVAKQSATSEGSGVQSVTIDVSDFTVNDADYVFYAVANVSGNIDDSFTIGLTTLDDFTAAVATNTGSNPIPGSNMLMVGYKTIAKLSSTTPSSQEIILQHRVARFDIDNLTADEDEGNDNLAPGDEDYNPKETFFTITKIRVFRTLSEGYLTEETNSEDPHEPLSARSDVSIPVSGQYGGVDINGGLAEGVFYLWPGELASKDDLHTGTAIEVEGYSTGGNLRLLTVQLEDARTIEANKRYKLTVSRIDQTNFNFTLTSSAWGDGGDDVPATPAASGAFEYSGFELNDVPLLGDDIDLSDNTGDSELSFYTDGDSKATGVLMADLDLTFGSGYAANDITPAPDGDPVATYSLGKVRQAYKITLPKTTYPISGTLTIDDGKGKTKVFNITSVPVYENTTHKPVLVEGVYWAPVNVGATSTTYSADLAGCGYIFQWGRSYAGFTYGSTGDTFGGPVSATEAETTHVDKFITNSSAETFNDWLNSQDDLLWSGENARGPCPAGWRVPTDTELGVLQAKYVSTNFANSRLAIPADEGATLYLPAAGYRSYGSAGTWLGRGTYGGYWSSSVDGTTARSFNFSSGSSNMYSSSRAYGYSVRCLQE
jgi:uncharacterized protein (TIGR02145 family)